MKNHLKILISELNKEITALDRIKADYNELMTSTPIDQFKKRDLRVIGSIFHDYYTCCEKIFKRIANHLDEELPNESMWHSELLEQMALDLPEIRPRVISESLKNELYEFMRFRHVIRNVYGFELDLKRIYPLIDSFDSNFNQFKGEITNFIAWLNRVDKK